MNHYRSLSELSLQKSWLAVGVFDGIHRGHQQLIRRLVQGARADTSTSVVLTFDPHPAKFFGRGEIKLLTLPDERANLLASMGVDVVVTHPFDTDVAETSALDFMTRLKIHLGLVHFVMGYDTTLGRNREGNATRLGEIGLGLGYAVETVSALGDERGVISSTEVRALVRVGNVGEAARLMSHPYSLQGVVVRGDQRGRTIGYPTANLHCDPEKLIPFGGIYACWATVRGERHRAAVNIGTNPTFTPDRQAVSVEAYLLDFDHDVYDEVMQLEFISRLRDELRFDSVETLVQQIALDVEHTRELLGTG